MTSEPGKAQNVNQVRCTRTAGNWRPGGNHATAWQVRGKAGQTGTAPNPTGPSSSSVPEGVKKLANENIQLLLRIRLSYTVQA